MSSWWWADVGLLSGLGLSRFMWLGGLDQWF